MAKITIFVRGLGRKLLLWFLVLSIVPLVVVGVVSFQNSSASLRDAVFDNLTSIRTIKKHQIEEYFSERFCDIEVLSENPIVTESLAQFEKVFETSGLNSAEYKQADEKFGKLLVHYKRTYGYYDMFLVADDGDIVYTVGKEEDMGTNLESGPYADTSLGEAFRNAKKGIVELADFHWYEPSNAQASFIGAQVKDNTGADIGVVICQVSIDKISHIMGEVSGMGKTGETYLVGEDSMMRSESRFEEDTIGKRKVDTIASREALSGREGIKIIPDYRGNRVLSSYSPVEIKGVNWAIISEKDLEEVFMPATNLRKLILSIGLFTVGLVIFIALLITGGIANPIAKAVMLLTSSSSQILAASRQHTTGLEQESTQITQVTTSAQQLTLSAKKVQERAQGAAQLSEDSLREAKTGGEVVDNSTVAMGKIKETVNATAKKIEGLGERSAQISEVVIVIEEIAEQVSLLALNASIEAARAGEAGKGFAVVADSVGKLADRATKSTKDINNLIKTIQSDMSAAVTSMEENTREVEAGTELFAKTGEAFRKIAVSVQQVFEVSREVTLSAQQQTSGSEQIAKAMANIDTVMKQSSIGAKQTAESAGMIAELGESFREMIGQVKENNQPAGKTRIESIKKNGKKTSGAI